MHNVVLLYEEIFIFVFEFVCLIVN